MNLILQKARNEQIEAICNLVNLAYRGAAGWTKESDLIMGNRSTLAETKGLISNEAAHLLVATENNEIVACVCVEEKGSAAHIGYFAVHPTRQGCGVGKEILRQAEDYAINTLKAEKYVMLVVSQREELISFYERRGYSRTGKIAPFPVHLNVGMPLIDDLTIEYMEKCP